MQDTIERYIKIESKKDEKPGDEEDLIEILDIHGSEYIQEVTEDLEVGSQMTKTMQRTNRMKMTGVSMRERAGPQTALKSPKRPKRAKVTTSKASTSAGVGKGESAVRDYEDEAEQDIPEEDDADVEQESSVESEATTVVEEVAKPHLSLRDETNLMGPV